MTTADYLNQLVKDVNTVRTNLTAKGVAVTQDETLTTLAPKISSISADLTAQELMTIVDTGVDYADSWTYPTYTEKEITKVENYLEFYGGDTDE